MSCNVHMTCLKLLFITMLTIGYNYRHDVSSRSVKNKRTNIFANNLDVHHPITYMYINFQQNWVSKSVKTVRTNIFAKNCKLHKFATMPIKLFKNQLLQTCIIIKRTCMSIFSKIGLIDQSKPGTQKKMKLKLHKFATCN